MKRKSINNILNISSFPPRECGIATFTRDLSDAINKKFNLTVKSVIAAINNESTDLYHYKNQVIHQVAATDIEDYISLANKINENNQIKLVHIQHEFGIFGGEYGNHLVPFLQVVKKPVIMTFHSVLPRPNKKLKHIVQFFLKNTKAIIVMNEFSKNILQKQYEMGKARIFVLPHGIPQVPFDNGTKAKQKLGFGGKIVLSTFGLLSPGKGIEYAIRALPEIVKQFSNTLYLIIGTTHPLVRKQEGERYRNFLKQEVEKLGLKNNVKFYNKYLTLKEVVSYLKATDIYLSPALNQEQSVSGTLSYALGCGRAVVSTASSYAKNIVTPERGILVDPKDSKAITKAVLVLIKNPELRYRMARTAYTETRHMTWPNVARSHFELYQKYANLSREEELPPVTLKHLKTLTDSFGIIQFAKNVKPDLSSGYCIDDNARAMIVAAKYWLCSRNKQIMNLLQTYLRFLKFAQKPNGVFINFVNHERMLQDTKLIEDAQGRAIWSLGYLLSEDNIPTHIKNQAEIIFKKAVPTIKFIKSPRVIAFAISGLYFYSKKHPRGKYKNTLKKLADSLINDFRKATSKDWAWFENLLTYSNSKLPEALFDAYLATGEKKYLKIAEQSLRFLINITFDKKYFSPIGQNGWYFQNGKRAFFDQQPEDASSMVQTLVVAHQATRKEMYKKYALQAFSWFLGENYLNQAVYDEATGGCYDGLGQRSLNINQGAESTISYLLARLALEEKT
ncbi:MAG: glycosyltransferase [Candidatus Nealsonbacteria bacterium]|nr:glycosyltransferase [Candidatus Nealsonbacteria bacterium]